MKTQNRVRQRNRKPRRSSGNTADTVGKSVTPFRVWDTIKQLHPYKIEILNVVRMLSSIGANHIIIAATLDLQGWKTFYGSCEWTEEDVKDLVEGYRA